jgi:hypothetical protein
MAERAAKQKSTQVSQTIKSQKIIDQIFSAGKLMGQLEAAKVVTNCAYFVQYKALATQICLQRHSI